ncbi:peptidase M18, aminopeptidase I [Tothia fuscella]|uniref:aspartyl aminopeptidase n=1 Tax=Tothia fuscella TaxID=1048955 RepID=A0A9P4U2I2_9PEZI|nr:peptidase M18, aminopeptidase I [Tothia fuscella]
MPFTFGFSAPLRSKWALRAGSVLFAGFGAYTLLPLSSRYKLDEIQQPKKKGVQKADEIEAARRSAEFRSAKGFCEFADSSPSVYHAVDTVKKHLLERNFTEIEEKDAWGNVIQPGGRYFVTRSGSSGSSIIAFAVGGLWEPGNPFAMIATHIDSPCLKLKPVSDRRGSGFEQVGVETYGGGLWHTWFDRDLGVAGRAYVRTSPTTVESQIVQLDEPILRVPTVAVHLEKQNPFKFDTESTLLPVAAQRSSKRQADQHEHDESDLPKVYGPFRYTMTSAHNRHNPSLVGKLADKLNVNRENILDFDLALYDIQKATLGSLNNEFIFSARIDNLMMSYCALNAFTNSLESRSLESEKSVRMLVMFDHEEIGSVGPIGAQSSFLPSTLQRISALQPTKQNAESDFSEYNTAYDQAIARSFMISADMHHGHHPNYSGYHESAHRPVLNGGVIIASTSRRYLSKNTPGTIMLLEMSCKCPEGEVPPTTQQWVAVNGGDCGSTVGPHLETRLGARTIDLGNAALSMHSIREMAGTRDVLNGVRFLQSFYENYSDFEDYVLAK